MVTNNIIPLHFKTRAQKHFFFFFPLNRMCVSDRVSRHENTDAAVENEGLFPDELSPGHEDIHIC